MRNEIEIMENKRGRGGPKKLDSVVRIDGWVTENEKLLLDKMSKESGKSKSEIIRRAIRNYNVYTEAMRAIGEDAYE